MFCLAYISTATAEMGDAALVTLLRESRTGNLAAGVTGFLLYRDGRFLQYLEGSETAVRDRMRGIGADPRHRHIVVLVHGDIAEGQFPNWSMGFNPSDIGLAAFVPGFMGTSHGPTMSGGTAKALTELIIWFRRQPGESIGS